MLKLRLEVITHMRVQRQSTLHQMTWFPHLFPVNCYLIEENETLTLIDTGLAASYRGIVQTIQRLEKPLSRIVLTHIHTDHIGSLDRLKQTYPEAKVYIPRRDARIISGDLTLDSHEAQRPIRGSIPKQLTTFPDVFVDDGYQIGSLLSIAVPGHTPGSMAYLDTRNRQLIAGDAFQIKGGLAVAGHLRWTFPFPALATWDKQTAWSSARKLLHYQPSLLAVGHGDLLVQPESAIREAIEAMTVKYSFTLSH